MPRHEGEFRRRRRAGPAQYSARTDSGHGGYGYRAYGDRGELGYGPEYYREHGGPLPGARPPMRPARGYPVRGYHTYDLDYGRQAGGPTTDYSGRAGYAEWPVAWPPRGPYTPWLEETRGPRPYRSRFEERGWGPAEPPWRGRRAPRGYARGYGARGPRR